MSEPTVLKRTASSNELDAKRIRVDGKRTQVVQEKDVGILQFANKFQEEFNGFSGTIKQRYSDFLVNEINLKGDVVHLEDDGIDLGVTKKERRMEKRQQDRQELHNKTPEEVESIKEEKRKEKEKLPKYELSDEHKKEILTYLKPEELQSIEDLFTNGSNTETSTTFSDKKQRGNLHKLLRESFQGHLDTVTTPENTFKIALAHNSKNPRRQPAQEKLNHVDENGIVNYGLGPYKNYLHFTVYKENRETMEVASTISKYLRIPPKNVSYAGTKDRRGVTCQKFSIHRGKVARVTALNKALRNIVLGGFSYEDNHLSLGDLKGNEFVITIRDVKANDESKDVTNVIKSSFESFQKTGFINYYGMQRFGTFSISTHVLGIKLLQEDWKGAAELILSEQETVLPDSVNARRIWAETSNPNLALKHMPSRCTAECAILSTLSKEKLDENGMYSSQSYFKGIMSIPRNLRTMYVHAYQSYIWNTVTSKRIELFGSEVQEGDLVLVDKKNDAAKDEDFEEDVAIDTYLRARPLTKEDLSNGKYTIFDVVLPAPGFDILYPTNEILAKTYVDAMAPDGLDPYKMTRKVREFSLAGTYRHIMMKPGNLKFEIVKYKGDTEPIVRTDLELLGLKKQGDPNPSRYIENNDPEASETALVLSMQLGVSSYATMALRELMRIDTARLSESFNVKS